MAFKAPKSTTTEPGVITLAGDLGGTATSPSVLKINGASVPAAGSLTTGNVLQVNGSSSLTYGAVNLAGGANFVTGNLPVGNFAPGTSAQVLMSNATPATTWTTIGGDVSLSATGSVTVNQIAGSSPVNITTAATFQWSSGVSSPTLTQASTSGASGQALTINAQNATGASHNGGNLILTSGSSGSATAGNVQLQIGTTTNITWTSGQEQWAAGISSPTINQAAPAATNTPAAGQTLLINSQAGTAAVSGNNAGGNGGVAELLGGTGGTPTGTATGGNGGISEVVGGTGGLASTTSGSTGGNGGQAELLGGTGGAGNGSGTTGGVGGAITVDAGAGGAAGGGTAGANGAISIGTTNAASIGIGRSGITTTVTGGLTQLTGAVSITGNAASSLTTTTASGHSLTITAGDTSTWSTAGGSLTVDSAAALNLGNGNATSVAIGKSGITTTVTGGLSQQTGAVNLTANAASQFTTSSGALTITSNQAATWSTSNGALTLSGAGGINLQNNGTTNLTLTSAQLQWASGITTPAINQATGSGAGTTFSVTAQAGAAGTNNGGGLTLTSGAGGAGSTTTAAGSAGQAELLGGTGGAGGTSGAAAAGGVSLAQGGVGGVSGSSSGQVGGTGGAAELFAGAGGAGNGAGTTGGTGGNVVINSGAGGAAGGGSAGAAGNVQLQIAGTTNITWTSGLEQWAQGITTPTINQAAATGAGTSLTLQAQNAGGSNNTGGNLVLTGGTKTGSGFDGYVFLEAGGNVEAFVNSSLINFSAGGLGIGTTPGTDPTISRGTGAPSTTQPNGSVFLRTDGTASTGIYTRQSGAWSAVGGSGTITLTGDVTGSGSSSIATTVAAISGSSPIVITPAELQWTAATTSPKIDQAAPAATNTTAAGQTLLIQSQAGTAAVSGNNAGGAGGIAELLGGTGGVPAGTSAGGAGGVSEVVGGTGGAASATSGSTGGAGGQITIQGGTGGTAGASGTTGGNGGNIVLNTGAPGAAGASGTAGGNGTIFGQVNGTQFLRMGKGGANANHYSIWLGDTTGSTSASGDYCLSNQGGGGLIVNAPSSNIQMSVANGNTVLQINSTGIVISGYVQGTRRTNSANATYTIDSTGGNFDYIIVHNKSGAVTYVLPAPTDGRLLTIKDITGALETTANNIFIAPNAVEKIENSSGSASFAITTLTNGSTSVTTTSSEAGVVASGCSIKFINNGVADSVSYIVSSFNGTTGITLATNYAGTVASPVTAVVNSLTYSTNFGALRLTYDSTDSTWLII